MSGDLQTRKRKGKGKKKGPPQVLVAQDSEQEAPAHRVVAYDLDDDVAEVKTSKAAVNGSHRGQSTSSGGGVGGNGSGVVAKVVFLVLLLALSLVVALIVVELRAGMKDTTESVMPEAAPVVDPILEPPAPDIPPLVVEEELPVPPPPPPVLHEADVEEYEPMEATPPLDEYVRVVQQPQEQVEEIPQPAKVVEEVEAPVVVEEVVEVLQVEDPQEAKVVEKLEAPMEILEEVPVVEEVVEVVVEETPVVEVVEIVEETPVEEVIEVIEEVVESKEEPKPVEEGPATPVVEKVVEEPAIPESSQAVVTEEAPSQADDEEEEEEVVEKTAPSPSQVAEEEEEEDWSQFGKEGSTEMLTDAYLGVESLASEILAKDPQNPMVAQLTPHLAGVVRAMEDGQTEDLLDTLRHIETILQDVKTRLNLNMDKVAGDSQQPPPYEKADITSDIDNSLREELDAADKLLPRGP